jgi:hypothetical protein
MAKKHEVPLTHCLEELSTHGLSQEADQLQRRSKKECGDDPQAQVRFLNRHFRDQLSKMQTDTIDAREALLDDCPPEEWNGLFSRHVLPVIAKPFS